MNLALKGQHVIPKFSECYRLFSNTSINDRHKSLILLHYFSQFAYNNIKAFMGYNNVLSSDRRLWHLSIRMNQLG